MLTLERTQPEILQLYVSYVKTFLLFALIVLGCMAVLILLSYQHIKVEANRTSQTFKVSTFDFRNGFNAQTLPLSAIRAMSSNAYKTKNSRFVNQYENPTLEMQDGKHLKLLKKSRNVLFISSLSTKFNQFLSNPQVAHFSRKVIYLGNLTNILLATAGLFLFGFLTAALLVGDVKMTFDRQASAYNVHYFSPLYPNKKGNLSDIDAVLVHTSKTPYFEQKQSGVYLQLKNQEVLLIQALGDLSEENFKKSITQTQEIADFLGVKSNQSMFKQ